jgi:ATP synthase protein I
MDRETRRAAIQLAYASSIGIAMVMMVFGGLFFGIYLDRKLETGNTFTFVFLVIGLIAGFRNIYVLIKKNFTDARDVITCIKSEPHRKRPPPKKT